ncbi:transglycosylase SLT domain-containing protein [Mesorhizobium sp.]|uniref:transglycosylase SLT domain-containing protein n=1 Tax=Mesorhizobium sp. TaxID=1871066 RepID=UPI000FE82FBB|nr:transglycosylase SLT domain-containing protein [Mesorhizobium sp.]RWN62308.1 MAG: lytic transglycosylase domain-containing protein [Mesorhizobium sp.]RWO33053.1 MAG: lytic transglycosylase domain-containing protein [Mesorhizobium sp.]RWO55859.1 MAG: lytic transglycosylase domain-containing protein [Mesorhizobium sp.]TIN29474.1 MAG: lytic transglycosylase domain-containing protein [Mesorhizobium sp.]TIN40726.1 MAG: lytic transglycosylase domain-containing protein [Mesorhizobium sp.]
MSKRIAGLGLAATVAAMPWPVYSGVLVNGVTEAVVATAVPFSALSFPSAAPEFDIIDPDTISTSGREGERTLAQALKGTVSILSEGAEQIVLGMSMHEFGEYKVSQHIASEILRAAKDTQFPADTLFAIAEKESSFDINNRPSKGSALGLMQFLDQTWLEAVKKYGAEFGLGDEAELIRTRPEGKREYHFVEDKAEEQRILEFRRDPYLSAALAAKNLLAAKQRIEARLEKAMDERDLYLPHFLGTNGAAALLSNANEKPNATASTIFPNAARFNIAIFKAEGKQLTVGQFHQRLRSFLEARIGKYSDVETRVKQADLSWTSGFENLVYDLGKRLAMAMRR